MKLWKNMDLWKKMLIILTVIAVLFANPYSRTLILFLLPLGSGIDDLIEFIVIVAAIVVAFCGIVKSNNK